MSEFTEAQVESIRVIAKQVFGEIFHEAINASLPVHPYTRLRRDGSALCCQQTDERSR